MAKEKRKTVRTEEQQRSKKILSFSSEPETEQPRPRRKFGWLVILALLAVIAIIVVTHLYQIRSYNDYEVISRVENSDATRMSYAAYNGSLIKYSQEGISYLDRLGELVWVEGYKMKQPVAVISDEYIAVADLNGNSVYIFNEEGKVSYLEMPYTICNVDVASQGVFAVVLENETENFIELYDKNGRNIVEMRTTIADSGYPLDIALSNDGSKLISSYITVDGITIRNSIAAYNFGDVGQNETDRLVGGFNNLDDTIVPKVEFLNNDTICAFGDNQFIFYSMKEKPSEKSKITDLNNEIQSIFYNSKYVGIVENLASSDVSEAEEKERSQYRLRVFDTNGNVRFSKSLNFTYHTIYATEKEIIIVGASESRIYDFHGNLKFSYSFPREVKNIIPTGLPQRYIVVYDDATELIRLQYTKEEDEEVQ